MQWPVHYADQLILLNPSSPVALCTLWSRKEDFARKVDQDAFALVGNLYTVDGISYMIKNVLARPTIKHVILVGHDLTGTGQVLLDLMREGVEEDGRIKGHKAYLHRGLVGHPVEVFRKYVKVYDLRGLTADDADKINSLAKSIRDDAKPFCEPMLVADEGPGQLLTESEEVGYVVRGDTMAETWLRLLDTVMKFGEVKESEYGTRQKEVLDALSVVHGDGDVPDFFPFGKEDLERYTSDFFSPNKPPGVDYTYGNRLFAYAKQGVRDKSASELREVIDQVEVAKRKLMAHPFTRRAVAVTWSPEVDADAQNPPCLMEINWSVKFGRLYQTATFRSHDVFGAWFLNAYALRAMQKRLAAELGLPPGDMLILSVSAHVYENNWAQAKELLSKAKLTYRFRPDPRGYFLVEVDHQRQLIRVTHKLNDGRDSGYRFEGRSAELLYKQIVNEGLISYLDHAAYLGKELQRAQQALQSGLPFSQDAS